MIYNYLDNRPQVKDTVFIAPGARVIGKVELEEHVGIWYNAVVRGDVDVIKIGPRTNIQDGCVLHQDAGVPLLIGAGVTVGHMSLLHGCTIEDGALIGMRTVVLSGARVGARAMVGAGSLVLEGQEIPPGMLALGSPAKVVRELSSEEKQQIQRSAESYMDKARQYREEKE